ncbi:MAG: hypothetical protein M3Q50_06435 [Chloroflexota bacterium]|nr:hypothetical protein [Chloroflexia bacterium]MDQ3226247.1 hypothetical protein [Chloroflexota bacterium]
MDQLENPNGDHLRLPAARDLLERRGILPDGESYTTRELARELTRRGWRWNLDADEASATKAYAPVGAVEQTVTAKGLDQVATLTTVLADAIRFDEEHGLSLAKPYRADIIVRAPDDRVIAVVEIKNREHLTSNVAVKFRRDLLTDARLSPAIRFFLFVSQDAGFLWDTRSDSSPFAKPTMEFPLETVVAHYLPWFNPPERISGEALEFVVARWLDDLAQMRSGRTPNADHFFAGTDFLDSIHGATVHTSLRV